MQFLQQAFKVLIPRPPFRSGYGQLIKPVRPRTTTDPKYWHDRAALMRALAATTADVELRVIMLRLAGDYDKLADRTARRTDGEVPPR